ncbi:MAG TPA: heme peroxidase family protein [Solirubrobacterales bacterium]
MEDREAPAPTGSGWGGGTPEKDKGDNPRIPAGYTYLGQFIDHDITFDPASQLLRFNDPNALHNFRTPRFDLDSLYGEGPDDEPFLYEKNPDREPAKEGKMLVEDRGNGEFDLPRNSQSTALLGDPRNDENTVVSQLQATMLRAHNKLVDALGGNFEEARRQLRWHYQYVVANDFLRLIVPKKVMDSIVPDGEKPDWCRHCHCHFGHRLPFMPVEFSVAAYRFGHSMVRPIYDLNANVLEKAIFDKGSPPDALTDLRGFRRLPDQWGIAWEKFFKLDESNPQPSRLIDIRLAPGLFQLPAVPAGDNDSLAGRNLLRGKALGLPWGEAVAKRLGFTPLTTEEALDGLTLEDAARKELEGRTPLWFYVLREAEKQSAEGDEPGGGEALGPVGGWIVAQTLVCLLAGDKFAYVNIEPDWTPAKAGLVPHEGDFEMADLIRFAIS